MLIDTTLWILSPPPVASPAWTFDAWLGQQMERGDAIGKLARDAVTDPAWPRGGTGTDRYLYMAKVDATIDSLTALAEAHREYRDLPT